MFDKIRQHVDILRERAGVPVRTPDEQAAVERAAQRLTLYHRPTCPFCIKVFIAMRRLDVPLLRRDISQDRAARDELVAGGGRQMVPCLRIDEDAGVRWLYESRDIIDYLEERFGPPDD